MEMLTAHPHTTAARSWLFKKIRLSFATRSTEKESKSFFWKVCGFPMENNSIMEWDVLLPSLLPDARLTG